MTNIDWNSDWIWRSRRVRTNDFAYFRKTFDVREQLISARMYVSAHHYVHVYVNGVKTGGYGTPAPTDPWKRKWYTEYDVLDRLAEGRNCITADAHYLGGGGQNATDGLPGFRLELHLSYAGGKTQVVKTDTGWDTLTDMPHKTGTPYQQNRRVSAIEDYDARLWDPSWRLADWPGGARTSKAKKARIGRHEWRMMPQTIPEGAAFEEIRAAKVGEYGRADRLVQVFDAGHIVSGWPRVRLKGIAGVTVRLRYSEDLDEHGRVKHNVANEKAAHYYDQYTMRGDEEETWQPDFSYKAFRYVEVTGYPHAIEPGEGLAVIWTHTAIEHLGSFRCSDPHLNELYDVCIRTQRNNTLGQTVDCPHREQAQYIADTDLQAENLLYNFNALPVLEKTLSDFADAQLDDGTFPFVAPTNYDREEFRLQIPEWDLHYATLLWKVYEASGDRAILSDCYEPLTRMVDYFVGIQDKRTGLVPLDKGWHISDWPYPSVEHEGEFLTVQQIKLILALRIAGRIAGLIGDRKAASLRGKQEKRLTGDVLKHLYDAERGLFRDSIGSARTHQGVTALALHAGIVPEADRTRAIAYAADKEWECRTVLSLPLLRMLFENGREREAYAILDRRDYPGWGYMLAQGARTLWEGWEDIESHSHAWNGYPARLLQEYVAGIRSEAPGFAAAVFRPYLPESLSFAEAGVWTVHGTISFGWERAEQGRIRMYAAVPRGVSARVEMRLPSGHADLPLQAGTHRFVFDPQTTSFEFSSRDE